MICPSFLSSSKIFLALLNRPFLEELFREMSAVAKETGNTFEIGKDGLTGEDFLNLIRRTALFVGNDGKVSRPSLYLPPDTGEKVKEKLDALGPDFEARVNALWEEKEKLYATGNGRTIWVSEFQSSLRDGFGFADVDRGMNSTATGVRSLRD